MKMLTLTKFVATVITLALCAFPAIAQEVQINIESSTTITISAPVLESNGRTVGVKYYYDHAEQFGDSWIAWNDGEDPMREAEGQTKCWPTTNADTGERGHICGTFFDGQKRF